MAATHEPAPSNTTMSPGLIGRRWYTSLLTSTLSPTSRVVSIEEDGMKKAWTTNVLMTSAMVMASTIRTTSSTQNGRRLVRPLPALPDFAASSEAPAVSEASAAPGPGSAPSAST